MLGENLDRTKLVPVTLVYCHTEFATCNCDYVAYDCISFCSRLPEFESHRMPFCANEILTTPEAVTKDWRDVCRAPSANGVPETFIAQLDIFSSSAYGPLG